MRVRMDSCKVGLAGVNVNQATVASPNIIQCDVLLIQYTHDIWLR